ncbi:MAG: radical SAM family heme chaperone HemW [Deltaproteobacteria bacterium]|nr:radical SAM family heme chaperone HemW [Deltaproteobacteria bacterium]
MTNLDTPGLYVHVPFCGSKCVYCDFFSVADSSAGSTLIPDWLEGIKRESGLYAERFDAFDTLYVGGGTPSFLSDDTLSALFDHLFNCFSIVPGSEITIEANPDDISREKLSHFKNLGVNRVSLGVQSFHDQDLVFLKRRHSAGQARDALELIKSESYAFTLSLDLIFGLPGQTEKKWEKSLERALSYEPEHISCYQLTYEEGTPLSLMKDQGLVTPCEEDRAEKMFLAASRFLEDQGYVHYEISNFALGDGNRSRHNRKYWRHTPYLGLGPAAHSFKDNQRWWNVRSIETYRAALAEGGSPVEDTESLTGDQLELEAIFLGLRTREGFPAKILSHGYAEKLSKLEDAGFITVWKGRVRPTVKGFLVADSLPLQILE